MAASIFSLRSCVAVAVMSGAQQSEIVRLGGAALGVRYDVIDLQQVLRAAATPAGAVHVAATASVALPDLTFTAAGMARPVWPPASLPKFGPRRRGWLRARRSLPAEAPHLRRRSRVARRRSCRSVRAVRLQRRRVFVSRVPRRRRRTGLLLRCRSGAASRGGLRLRRRSPSGRPPTDLWRSTGRPLPFHATAAPAT